MILLSSRIAQAHRSSVGTGPRYWRIYSTATAGGWDETTIAELVFKDSGGTRLNNIADRFTKAFASSTNSSMPPNGQGAFDGNDATVWTSVTASSGIGVGQNAWVGWNFAAATSVASVDITIGPDLPGLREAPMTFTIESSADGISWTVKKAVSDAGFTASGQTKSFTI